MKVIEYLVVEGYSLREINEFVGNRINIGWQPLGGINTRMTGVNNNICVYTQAMVLYDKSNTPKN